MPYPHPLLNLSLRHFSRIARALLLAAPIALLVACGGGGSGGGAVSYGSSAPTVTSVTPLVATVDAPTVFAVLGTNLPTTAILIPQDGTCAAATGNTATGFSQQCTFTSAGQKSLVNAVGSGYTFNVNVAASQYVKICNDGSREGTFTCPNNPPQGTAANEWACTLDTLTNQMWEVKTAAVGLRNVNNQYTSFDDTTKPQKFVAGAVVPPTQLEIDASTNVVGYASALNDLAGSNPLCGSTKWRVPTLPELTTLVKGTVAPRIDSVYFPNTSPQAYITVTPQIFTPPGAPAVTSTNSISVVDFNSGVTNTFIFRETPRPVRLVSAPSPKSDISKRISAGLHHTCGIKNNGDVACWGQGGNGQLGNGTTYNGVAIPATVSIAGGATAVSTGSYQTGAITSSGGVVCWGVGTSGQLGNGGVASSTVPVNVSLTGSVTAISSGTDSNCAIKSNKDVVCWGYGSNGAIGNGSFSNATVPALVTLVGGARAVSVGHLHVCAIKSDGGVVCWGANGFGELGNGSTGVNSAVPVTANLPEKAIAISSGYFHTCAVLASGVVSCWGRGVSGQLGNGSTGGTNNSSVPLAIAPSLLNGVAFISAGYGHTCAVKTNGSLTCWGENFYGQLGNGSTTSTSLPTSFATSVGVTSISAGYGHTCAMSSTAGALCWGEGSYGKLGNGAVANANTPVSVSGF